VLQANGLGAGWLKGESGINKEILMVNIIIDGRKIKAKEGSTILENADELKIEIPTLCHHKELSPFGACRLCTVEVKVT